MSNQNLRPPAIPSGPKISDWCYTGALDSQPPTVKSNTLYETIRLLGRGAFGDVNLVKIPGENKLYGLVFYMLYTNILESWFILFD